MRCDLRLGALEPGLGLSSVLFPKHRTLDRTPSPLEEDRAENLLAMGGQPEMPGESSPVLDPVHAAASADSTIPHDLDPLLTGILIASAWHQ